MALTFLLVALACMFFRAGFLTPRHFLQYKSRVGFVLSILLASLAGYFALREKRTLSELAEFIDPVPGITDITYVPTATETIAISRFLATLPGTDRFGTTQAERRDVARGMSARQTEYWLLKTRLPIDSIFDFYRHVAPQRGWQIQLDNPPWLLLSRTGEKLVLFVADDFPRPGIRILYGLTADQH